MLPLLCYVVLLFVTTQKIAYGVGVILNVLLVLFFRYFLKKGHQFMLYITGITMVLYGVITYFPAGFSLINYPVLTVEILWLVILTCVIPFRPYVLSKFVERSDNRYSIDLKYSIKEFLLISVMLRPLITIHLLIIFAYHLITSEPLLDMVYTNQVIFSGIILGLFVFESIRLKLISNKLSNETWLPVVDTKGKVIGRIARSESLSRHAAKYTHPLVRCVVMHKGMLYLKERKHGLHSERKKIDIPFFKLVVFRQTIEEALQKLIGPKFKQYGEEPRFLLQYLFDNGKAKNLVSLYLINVKSEALASELGRDLGKLWTVRQIDENIEAGIFSEYFEQEYVYLKNTVLLAESFRNQDLAEQ